MSRPRYQDMPAVRGSLEYTDAVRQGNDPCQPSQDKAVRPHRLYAKKIKAESEPIGEPVPSVDEVLFEAWRQTAMNSEEAVTASAAMLAHSRVFHWS